MIKNGLIEEKIEDRDDRETKREGERCEGAREGEE